MLARLEVPPHQRFVDEHGQRRGRPIGVSEVSPAHDRPTNRLDVMGRDLVVPHLDAEIVRGAPFDGEVGRPQHSIQDAALCGTGRSNPRHGANPLEQPIEKRALLVGFRVHRPGQRHLKTDRLIGSEAEVHPIQLDETANEQRRANEQRERHCARPQLGVRAGRARRDRRAGGGRHLAPARAGEDGAPRERGLKRFQAKWTPVRVKKTRQIKI